MINLRFERAGDEMSRCDSCKKYSALHRPRKVDDQNYIYGFCFKDHHSNYGSVYPVYIPDGGVCKAYDRSTEQYEYEIDPAFQCECCKKRLREKIMKILN